MSCYLGTCEHFADFPSVFDAVICLFCRSESLWPHLNCSVGCLNYSKYLKHESKLNGDYQIPFWNNLFGNYVGRRHYLNDRHIYLMQNNCDDLPGGNDCFRYDDIFLIANIELQQSTPKINSKCNIKRNRRYISTRYCVPKRQQKKYIQRGKWAFGSGR